MPNTTTPASFAARLTDEEILRQASLVEEISYDGEIGSCGGFSCGDNSPNTEDVAAVLRDYVRMWKQVNAVRSKVSECNTPGSYEELKYEGELPYTSKILKSGEDIKRLLAEAEKEETK